MSALPNNIVPFELPKKPRVMPKDQPPDQRKVCVLPIRAVFDQKLTHGALQVLAALCSYCNRAGITWVSQTRLAKELGISQQAVAKQFKQLRENGYLETIRKGFKGERTDTLRVIFDPSVDAETAMAVASKHEDARPPVIKREQEREQEQAMEADPKGQKRIAQLISKALKQPAKPRSYSMPTSGETRTVREMKEAIRKGQSKRTKAVDKQVDNSTANHNPEVVHEEPLHSQPNHNLEVVDNTENIGIDKVKVRDKALVKDKVVLHNLSDEQLDEIAAAGLTDAEAAEALEHLLAAYQAEGLTPPAGRLASEIISLAAVGRGIA